MTKKIFIIILILLFGLKNSFSQNNIQIIAKINDQIITNIDIKKEISYLKILNPKLKNLEEDKISQIAKNSLINEKIKKNELLKIFNFEAEINVIDNILNDLLTNLNYNNVSELQEELLKKNTYSINQIKEKLKIEFFWNKIIIDKFKSQVKIDKEKLLNKIKKNNNNFKNEYLLAEIFFKKEKNTSISEQFEKIKQSINEVGFNNTASIYSDSQSANFGGKIGWIQEDSLSEIIINELKKIKSGQITNLIKLGNNYLILKIEQIKKTKVKKDINETLNRMIEYEKNRQLNQFSKIYFNKIKINYSINEK